MTALAALLRGISPGGAGMSNAELRGVFTGLGLAHVTSVLASGNILFSGDATDVPALESRIEDALRTTLGIGGGTLLRSLPELEGLLDRSPFAGLTHGRGSYLTATFLKLPATPELPDQPLERTRIVGYDAPSRAILAITDNSTPGATIAWMAWLEKTLGTGITTRTWATLHRIVTALRATPDER